MKTHPFRSMAEVSHREVLRCTPVRAENGRFFIGTEEVFPLSSKPFQRLHSGTKAAGFFNGTPLFLASSFYTPTCRGWCNWNDSGCNEWSDGPGDSLWEEMAGDHYGPWDSI